jgi:membrane-bound serine protease (ClpP class)
MRGHAMKKALVSVAALCIMGFYPLFSQTARYAVVTLDGTVNPIAADYIVKSIERAQKEDASFIILTVDTPGGLMNSMREIIKSILTSKIPVIVYTYPKGAQAASAGGFIMLAGNLNAMAPGTEIGAMHPVSPFVDFEKIGGQPQKEQSPGQEVMAAKVLNDTVAYGKSIAQKRGRNVDWTERAITKAVSASYKEAKALGIIDIIAEDIPDLVRQLDGRAVDMNGKRVVLATKNVSQVVYPMTWKEKIMNFFADPQIVFFLFIIAVVGIGFELKNPGLIFPGVIGGVSFLIFLMAIRILPINFAGVVLILLAITLFVLEIKYVSYGLLTLGGIVSFVLGSMILFDSTLPGFSIPIGSIVTSLIVILAIIFIILRAVIKAHRNRVVTGQEGLVGEKGTALTDITPKGKVSVHGEIWNAESSEQINKGDPVEVISSDGMILIIKKG